MKNVTFFLKTTTRYKRMKILKLRVSSTSPSDSIMNENQITKGSQVEHFRCEIFLCKKKHELDRVHTISLAKQNRVNFESKHTVYNIITEL